MASARSFLAWASKRGFPEQAVLAWLDERDRAQLAEGLRRMSNKHPLIGDVRGSGQVIGVDLVEDPRTRVSATKACAKVAYRAAELGAAVFYVGHRSNIFELTPPIILSESEIEEGMQILDRALEDVEAHWVPDSAAAAYAGW